MDSCVANLECAMRTLNIGQRSRPRCRHHQIQIVQKSSVASTNAHKWGARDGWHCVDCTHKEPWVAATGCPFSVGAPSGWVCHHKGPRAAARNDSNALVHVWCTTCGACGRCAGVVDPACTPSKQPHGQYARGWCRVCDLKSVGDNSTIHTKCRHVSP